jgi:hypothetical protein
LKRNLEDLIDPEESEDEAIERLRLLRRGEVPTRFEEDELGA